MELLIPLWTNAVLLWQVFCFFWPIITEPHSEPALLNLFAGLYESSVCSRLAVGAGVFGTRPASDSCTWTTFLPSAETHWQDFCPPSGWMLDLRVVREAMPSLWGATCSRRWPQDLTEGRQRAHVTSRTQMHRNCRPKIHVAPPYYVLALCDRRCTFVM